MRLTGHIIGLQLRRKDNMEKEINGYESNKELREVGAGERTKLAGKKLQTADLTYVALSAAVITVCAWISIPAAVPFTLQTFAVCMTAGLLGLKRGTLTIVVYLLMGAVGLPVFTGFRGGLGAIFGTTGGYLAGFLLTALIVGFCSDRFGRKLPVLAVSMSLGMAVCYAFGTVWYLFLYIKNTGPVGVGTVLSWCVIPFIIPDLLKIAAASVLTVRLKRFVK